MWCPSSCVRTTFVDTFILVSIKIVTLIVMMTCVCMLCLYLDKGTCTDQIHTLVCTLPTVLDTRTPLFLVEVKGFVRSLVRGQSVEKL